MTLAATLVTAPAGAQNNPADWSGFYLGGGAGYAFGAFNSNFQPAAGGGGPPGQWAPDGTGGSFSLDGNGGLYGFHAGYLQQWDRLVGGVEASIDLSNITAGTTNVFPGLLPNTSYNASIKWLATLTPRVGYVWNDLLFYGKAGLAIARVESSLVADANACFGPPCTFSAGATHVGFTVGVGAAYALTANWILGIEYNYYDLGSENYGGQTTPDTQWNTAYTLQPKFSTFRGRISYRFGGLQTWASDASVAPSAGDSADGRARWQGFYIGANAGYGWANYDYGFQPGASGNGGSGPSGGLFAPNATGGTFTQSGSGGVYGLQAGYNRQWDNLVGGIEFNVALSDISARSSNAFGAQTDPNATYTTNIKWLATLAPRFGMAWNQVLVYGKVGVAAARISSQLNSTSTAGCFAGGFGVASTCAFSEERTHVGVVAGAGIEYQFSPNWVFGVEYNYLDLRTESYGGTINPNTTWPLAYTVHPQLNIVRGRLSYKL